MSLLESIGDIKEENYEFGPKMEFSEDPSQYNCSNLKLDESSLLGFVIEPKGNSGVKEEDENVCSDRYPVDVLYLKEEHEYRDVEAAVQDLSNRIEKTHQQSTESNDHLLAQNNGEVRASQIRHGKDISRPKKKQRRCAKRKCTNSRPKHNKIDLAASHIRESSNVALVFREGSEDIGGSDDSLQDETFSLPGVISDSSSDDLSDDEEFNESNCAKSDEGIGARAKRLKRDLVWKVNTSNEAFEAPPWKDALPAAAASVGTPLEYFNRLVDDDTLEFICLKTNLYATQTNTPKQHETSFKMGKKELEQFIGVCFHMSIIAIPGTRRYWCTKTGIPQVYEVMARKRFEEIKRYLRFSDKSQLPLSTHDKKAEIEGLVDRIRANLNKIPLEQYLCVHEQIIPYKGKSILNKYNTQKPRKVGYKLFCLVGASGIIYDFEVHAGPKKQPQHLLDIGQIGNVVLRLAELIPSNKGYQLCFDNSFCSVDLQTELYKRGIYCIGKVHPHRVPNSRFPSDKEMTESGVGSSVEKTCSIDGVQLNLVKWQDDNCVNLLSSFVGKHPEMRITRYDKKLKRKEEVCCPKIVNSYNRSMRSVDKVNSLLALYRTVIRSTKYHLRIFFHLMDLCCIVAWISYKRDAEDCGLRKRDVLSLYDFKSELAQSLCWTNKARKRGDQRVFTLPSRKVSRSSRLPASTSRLDKFDHWPIYEAKGNRCKMAQGRLRCQLTTRVKCTKCNLNLCFVPNRNCFVNFHNQK